MLLLTRCVAREMDDKIKERGTRKQIWGAALTVSSSNIINPKTRPGKESNTTWTRGVLRNWINLLFTVAMILEWRERASPVMVL